MLRVGDVDGASGGGPERVLIEILEAMIGPQACS